MADPVRSKEIPEIDPTEIEDTQSLLNGQHRSFLEKVMNQAGLADLYDARDITEVVFRTMRDMMTDEAVEHVADELHTPMVEDAALPAKTPLNSEVVNLWEDTNPIVHFLSRVRPTLDIRDSTFLFRIRQEAGLPPQVSPEQAVRAVFSATKDELSQARIAEVADFLPGVVRQLWNEA